VAAIPPIGTPFLDPAGRVTKPWLAYFNALSSGANAYQNFTPVVSGFGSMTVSGTSVSYCWYTRSGADIFIQLDVSFTLGGTPSNILYITTPFSGVTAPTGQALTTMIQLGTGAWVAGYCYTENYPTARILVTPLFANWPLGASRALVAGRIRIT
jgi:hypothetical protein